MRSERISKNVALALLTSLLLLAGCAKESVVPPVAKNATKPAAEREGGRVVIRIESDITTLDYVKQTTDPDRHVLSLMHDSLIDFNQRLEPIPGLAQRWEVLDGGRTYVLHLDPRATFSDGRPVLASDVLHTLKEVVTTESPQFESQFSALDLAKSAAVGERSVRLVFNEARAGQLNAFAIGVLPAPDPSRARNAAPAGTGPYVLERRERGRSVLLKRRASYWRELPRIPSVMFRVVSDGNVAWKALQRGDLDVARIDNDLWWRVRDEPKVKETLQFHTVWESSYNAIVWNLDNPIFADARVRRALSMSFDRRNVIERLYHGQARPVTGPFTADSWANNPAVHPVEFNPRGAAALLGSAGWRDSDADGRLDRDGTKLEFDLLVVAGSTTSATQAQVFQEALRSIGVTVNIVPLDDAAFFESVLARNFQAAFLAWANDPDPDPYSMFHSTQLPPEGMNVAGYRSAEADRLIEAARTQFDRGRRTELYHQLHELLARDQPALWTVQVASKWAVNRRVQNVQVADGPGLFLWYPSQRAWWIRE